MNKILYGVCGIGNGHVNRQLAIIEELSKTSKILLFAYKDSLTYFKKYVQRHQNIQVAEVAVPFYVGNATGIDFDATLNHPLNQNIDFFNINSKALQKAEQIIGKPDSVISDYEPVSAQYAYACNAPLVTIDQQSKYLYGDLPISLGGFTFHDEIDRLHMFFPKASSRIASSFFKVKPRKNADKVLLFPSPLKDSIKYLKREPTHQKTILVYLSAAHIIEQSFDEILSILSTFSDTEFRVFTSFTSHSKLSNVMLYQHGDPVFTDILASCHGIISTAGHSLLSEAMFLKIPVFAMPVEPYEQYMNAHIIEENRFGVSARKVTKQKLDYFLKNIPDFVRNIESDKKVLIRGDGTKQIIDFLKKNYLKP